MGDIIFNDVSLTHSSIATSADAKKAFEKFLAEIAAAIDDGVVQSVLRSQISLLEAEISITDGSTWSVYDWFDSSSTDRDVRRLMLTLDNKVPVEAEYPLSDEDEAELMMHDYCVPGEHGLRCFAFGFALHTGSVVASIPTDVLWTNHSLPGSVLFEGTVVKEGVVSHLSQPDHSTELKRVLDEQVFDSIKGRADFVAQKERAFSFLRFSPEVDKQISALTGRQIENLSLKLQKMNKTAQSWQERGAGIPQYEFAWRGESEQTMNTKEFKKARIFTLPQGGTAVFESHLDFSASHRIHFIEDNANRTFVIGYVGDHLPTVKYKH